jgi:dethiobiotin synthetase
MQALFVTGAGTELGKTHVACALIRAWRAQGLRCGAFKPVASGVEDAAGSDPGRLLAALGEPLSPEALQRVCPWRFREPLAPPLAAEVEGVALDSAAMLGACTTALAQARAASVDVFVIEGAGGLLSPLTQTLTCLDLLRALGLPSLFVMGDYLGAVSHALSGLELLRQAQLAVAQVVVSESAGGVGLEPTLRMMRWFRPDLAYCPIPRAEGQDWAPALALQLLR